MPLCLALKLDKNMFMAIKNCRKLLAFERPLYSWSWDESPPIHTILCNGQISHKIVGKFPSWRLHYYRSHIISWRFCVYFFRQMALQSQKKYRQLRLWCSFFLAQEVNVGPPESKIYDFSFELDAERSKIHQDKTANLKYEPYSIVSLYNTVFNTPSLQSWYHCSKPYWGFKSNWIICK